ncbi:1,4-dihydroxy-2-naphthoate octaprenyltransferase MenA [Thermosynechococcus sp. NK55a]|jgi:1,4-dihydroxy-2-naphthoate octaprenyltransferase|uniref:2-carboxy-1,4-naphthoquinone phytyltransferase n=1 Tax=unclassified Thermosynechococcus TaxID=2622553 RepID=UPI0003D827D5|nr:MULTISPECIES: 2-carboxy-1,4-naphthoquinone phytyltransferase [unclassified Thermosynechococcus]AHB88814.1 1,4-dihydroxy-2-naphthoate octaprenyltransferase MenA [Thermosynechococcus sp. NK55a]RMH66284.1 MAG: 2-carboxy-1,4-naphthoquinone phytyltransferase [Cyanobacteria bacterium J003]HIK23697.1 2-carboxy-1,4-naphthoquinone phytyltransferase [Thermosynechococcus sp. M3746_W2019_013]
MAGSSESIDRSRLWWAAIKLPMYSVAVMPIWLGTAGAIAKTGRVHWWPFGLFLTAAVLILAWLNLSNDVFDAETGIDRHKYHSVVNLTGKKQLIFWLSNLCLLLGLLGIAAISWLQQDGTVLGLVLLCCALGYSYQGPPFRLGYLGLGEPICFICFGPLAIAAAYYSQVQTFSPSIWPVATLNGLTTTLILFCSHFHQVADDLAAGKRSPVVRLGTARSAQLVYGACGLFYGVLVASVLWGLLPGPTLLALGSLPWAIYLCQRMAQFHSVPEQIENSKFIAVQLHFWSSLLLGLGYLL